MIHYTLLRVVDKKIKYVLFFIIWLLISAQGTCQPAEKSGIMQQNWIPVLGYNFDKALFKTSLDISKNHLTGLMFFKQTSDSSFRIIFTNEMGMKFFDLEFVKEKFIIQYCFPSLSRKSLMKIFEADFRLLLSEKISGERIVILNNENPEYKEYKVKTGYGKYLFAIDGPTRKITRILSSGKLLGKTRVFFDYNEKPVPLRIHIENPAIKLSMKLSLLDN